MSNKYTLVDKEPVYEPDLLSWAKWFEKADRRVKLTKTQNGEVSTVFLGLDHNFLGNGPPVLFETMVFGGTLDGHQKRYCTYDQAESGHDVMVNTVTAAL